MTLFPDSVRSRLSLLVCGVLALAGLAAPTLSGAPAAAASPAPGAGAKCADAQAPFGVGTTTITLRSRGTTMEATVAYPATSSGVDATPVCRRSRLVVAGHGAEGDGPSAARLHQFLVQSGYVVAAPTLADGFDFEGFTTDVSRTISKVLRLSRNESGLLAGRVHKKRVGYVGTSMGGILGLALVDEEGRDKRIAAVVSKAGRFYGPGNTFDADEGPPLLMINGDADTVVSYDAAKGDYRDAERTKGFITLDGVGHDLNTGGDPILSESTLGFFAMFLRGRDKGLEQVEQSAEDSEVASLLHRW